jgi:hypothetical protein
LPQQLCRGTPLYSHAKVSVPDILNLNPENKFKTAAGTIY